jgi:hypothetical protein
MFLQRSKVLIASLIAAALIASCGGSDTTTRQRNVALEGKVQCLSDDGTTIGTTGMVQLDLCAQAKSFQILEDGSNVTEKIEVKPNSMNYFQAPAGKHKSSPTRCITRQCRTRPESKRPGQANPPKRARRQP